jgi:hypothetical protein
MCGPADWRMRQSVPNDCSEDRSQDQNHGDDRCDYGDHVEQEAERLVLAAQRIQHARSEELRR